MRNVLLTVWVLTAAVLAAPAQPLADRVPGDAVVYVGWRGADDPGPGYDGSNLQALGESSDLPKAVSQVLDMVEQTNAGDPQVAMVTHLVRTIGSASWRQPTAMYLQPADDPAMPVRFVALWQAQGEAGDALLRSLDEMLAQLPPDAPLVAGQRDGLVYLTLGPPAPAPGVAIGAPGAALVDSPMFARAMQQADPDGVLVFYIDGQGLVSLIDRVVQADASPDEQETWSKVRDALGLAGLNAAVWSCGFDGPDWRTDLFIDAPAPRTGVLALLDGQPITEDELRAVPAEATWFAAARFDLASLLDQAREVIGAIDPQMLAQLNDALLQGSAMTGIDLEADLIRSLGSAWLIYTDPGATGSGMMGLCLVNPLKDAEKAHRSLIALQALANAMMGQVGANSGGAGMRIRFQQIEHEGMTLHTLGIPFVAPTWSVHDGKLYVGLYPQVVMAAGDRARSGTSVLDNQRYQAVRDRLGGGEASSIVYTDLPRTAEGSYQNMVMLAQIGTGLLSMFGADSMPTLLPPYARIEPLLSPSGQVAWSDDAGYHSRSISPFPGSVMLGPQGSTNMMTMSGPMMLGITLPALGAARRSARQMKSTTQCRGIVQSQIAYASGNKDRYTNDIAELYENNFFSVEYVISPRSDIQLPRGFNQWDQPQRNQWVRQNASYILIPDLKMDINSETVCVFERPDSDGMAVGFNDGRAEFMDEWQARQIIETQTGMTLEELIERQRNYQPQAEQDGAPPAP